jgi:hypothetical protein
LTGFINLTYFQIRKNTLFETFASFFCSKCEESSKEIDKSSCERKGHFGVSIM